MNFLFFLIILALGFVVVVILMVVNFVRNLLGLGRRQNPFNPNNTQQPGNNHQQPKNSKKVFDKNEGEYVEYEEVNES